MAINRITKRQDRKIGEAVVISLLKDTKVLICMGTGGVGKTTISAALGLLAAKGGLKTLVLTIDPAKRLAQSLGIENRPGEDVAVEGVPGLFACMIDPQLEFDNFVRSNVENRIAEGLIKNPLYQQLVSSLSGSQEFTSLVRVINSVQGKKYDLVILDTPPVQNSVDFLRAPERMASLFDESVIKWFSPREKASFITRIVNRGTSVVTMALEKVTGSQFITELKDFFAHLAYLQAKVSKASIDLGQLLHSKETGVVIVTGFDEAKMSEAAEFRSQLKREQLFLRAIVVNRAFPTWKGGATKDMALELVELYEKMQHYFKDRIEFYDQFAKNVGGDVPILQLPDYNQAVMGIDDLEKLSLQISEKWQAKERTS